MMQLFMQLCLQNCTFSLSLIHGECDPSKD